MSVNDEKHEKTEKTTYNNNKTKGQIEMRCGKGSISRHHSKMKSDGRRNGPKWQQWESERDNTIITINMQPLLQNDTQKNREPQLKYYEMGECERRTEKIVEHWIKE